MISHQTTRLYLGWTWIVIKILSINMAAGDLLVPLHWRISLFVPFFSFEVLQRAAWMWESWTSLDLKTSRRTPLNNCASISPTSRFSFTSTSTYLPLNRWVWCADRAHLQSFCANASCLRSHCNLLGMNASTVWHSSAIKYIKQNKFLFEDCLGNHSF